MSRVSVVGGVISGMENLPSRGHIVEKHGGITGMENLPSSDQESPFGYELSLVWRIFHPEFTAWIDME